jgi:hypothetical protein
VCKPDSLVSRRTEAAFTSLTAPSRDFRGPKTTSIARRYEKCPLPLKSLAHGRETSMVRRPFLFLVRCVSTPRAPLRPIPLAPAPKSEARSLESSRCPPSIRHLTFQRHSNSEELSCHLGFWFLLLERALPTRPPGSAVPKNFGPSRSHRLSSFRSFC